MMMQTTKTYTSDGNHLESTYDERMNQTAYDFSTTEDVLYAVCYPNGQAIEYGYDGLKRLTLAGGIVSAGLMKNEYTYEHDMLKEVKHTTTSDTCDVTYTFEHDDLGRQTRVKVGTQELSANTYNAGAQTLANVTYGNGGKVSYEYDQFKRVTGVKYDDESANRFEYEYGADGRVAYVKDTNLKRTVWTERDLADRPARLHIMNTDDGSVVYRTKLAYDEYNNLSEFKEDVGGSEYATTYTYDSDNRPTAVKFGTDTEKVVYTYDELGRMATRKQYNGSSSTVRNSATYSYLAGSQSASGYTSCTPLVSGINQTGIDFSYAYEAKTANITSEARTGGSYGGTTTYAYDSMGQLTRVNDPIENATWVYTYDLGGNILNKKKYAYTTGTVGSVQQTIAYTYGETNWKDKLTAYNGVTLNYDNMGNITNDGTWTYAWAAGRQLSGMNKSGTSVEFDYDHNGLRVKKKVGTSETHYTLKGKLLVHQMKGSDWMHFYYDAQGRPAMVNFNGTKYHYLHNLQGDIIGIVDASGNIVVEYKYDAWGKIIARTGSLVSTLGYLNPFRYRGYVYDEETGLYYLRSRYYSPEWGRFITADFLLGACGSLLSHNVFAYCVNNPIACEDPDGAAFLIALYVGVMAYVTAVMSSPDIHQDLQSLAMSAAQGDTTGMVFDTVGILLPGLPSLKGFTILKSADDLVDVSKQAKVVQVFEITDDLNLPAGQMHHALPVKPMRQIAETVPDLAATGIRRNDWIFHARNLAAHYGYDTPHRELTEKIIEKLGKCESVMRTGQFTREDLAKVLMEIYKEEPYRTKFGCIVLK